MALAGTEAVASEAVGAASVVETVEDSEEATKWEEGGSLLDQCSSVTTRGRGRPESGFIIEFQCSTFFFKIIDQFLFHHSLAVL